MKLHRIVVCVTLLLVGCGGASASDNHETTQPVANATTEPVGPVAPAVSETQATAAETIETAGCGRHDGRSDDDGDRNPPNATAAETAAAETTASTAASARLAGAARFRSDYAAGRLRDLRVCRKSWLSTFHGL